MNATLARLTRLTADPPAAGDGPLLTAFLAGDEAAFAALVRRHAGLVFATCRRVLRHQQDAEDAFQATFLVLARRAADVWPREAVGAWLFGVAHRVALKARSVRRRQRLREQPLSEFADAERTAPDFDLVEGVHRVVSKLPEMYWAAVVACDLEGLSRKEAAERLGWTEGTLSGRLARARELLATRLRQVGLSLPAGGLVALFSTEVATAADVEGTIRLATGAAAGASAPVAALTEGAVRSMALMKLKAVTASLVVVCALGCGVFAAAGPGDGLTGQPQPARGEGVAPTPATPRPPEPPAKPILPQAKPLTDRDRLQGTWRIVSIAEGDTVRLTEPKDPWFIEVSGSTLRLPYKEATSGWKHREYAFAIDEGKTPRTIDLISKTAPLGRGLYQLTLPAESCAGCHKPEGLGFKLPHTPAAGMCEPALKSSDFGVLLALSIDGKRPEKFGGAGVIVFEMRRAAADNERERLDREAARLEAILKAITADDEKKAEYEARLRYVRALAAAAELETAQRQLRLAEAEAEQARIQVAVAGENLKAAKAKLAAAEKAVADLKKPQPGTRAGEGESFTVHVRTLTAAEKVIRVRATGKESVLEGLVYAADDVPLKSDGVSVWIVRDKSVLPVDLPSITKNGETKTNSVLKAGDQLFVQVKAK